MRKWIRHAWRATAFTYDLIRGERDAWMKRSAGPVNVAAHRTVVGARTVDYDRYDCARFGTDPRPGLVVTHGFTHQGHGDPRLQALCRRLARVGFVVIAPAFDEMRHYRLGLGDQGQLEAAVAVLRDDHAVDATAIGVMAFSFGSAPTLIGLAHPPLRDTVAFAVVFGGYFDLKRTFRYVLTGAYEGFGYAGRLVPPETGDDRWKFLRGNLGMIPPSPTSAVLANIADQRVADPTCVVDLTGCSDDERAAFALIENRDPERYAALFDAAGSHVHAWIARLSPMHSAEGIRAKLFLVHSFTDQKTPFIESIAMSRAVPNAPAPTLVLVNAFAHVDLRLNWRSVRSLLGDGLPGLFAIWNTVRRVMAVADL